MIFKNKLILMLSLFIIASGTTAFFLYYRASNTPKQTFNAERAYQDLVFQVNQGPRVPGSAAHMKIGNWLQEELEANHWNTSVQEITWQGQAVINIVGKRGRYRPLILLGAHYDSRQVADRDPLPSKQASPVPGANDGASGVAVLLELARTLPPELEQEIWIVFFDAEDQGNISGWDWILGSKAFAENLTILPDYVVIIDMIGDKDLNIHLEKNSNQAFAQQIWGSAASLGYSNYFIPEYKYQILDDHLPFAQKGIPAVDIIDFDYPSWHTIADTPDKTSPNSLKVVGETLYSWLITQSKLAN